MNKKVKAVSSVIVFCIALSVLCVSVFAEDGYINIINDRFSVNIPDDYIMVDNTTNFYFFVEVESADFICEDYLRTIEIRAYSNDEFTPENINEKTDEQLKSFGEYYLKPADGGVYEGINGEYKNVDVKSTKMNGCTCAEVNADYVYSDMSSHFNVFIFTAKTMIYVVYFESPENGFDIEDRNFVLNSFSMNSEHFDGDKEINSADFSEALPYKEAHDSALEEYGYFGGYYDDYYYNIGEDPVFETFIIIGFILISIFTGVIPLIIIIVAAVDLSRKKKKLREYEARFGNIIF